MGNGVKIVTVSADDHGQRIDNYLMRELPGVPKSHVYKLLRSGQVRVDGGRVKPLRKLRAGERVRIPPVRVAEREASRRPPDALIERLRACVIHEDEHYIALDKPEGVAVHGGTGVAFGLIEVLRVLYPDDERIELCHRLDRETSGLLLVARGRRALLRVHAALRDGRADKRYLALLDGVMARGCTVDSALATQRELGGERRTALDEDGRQARSDFSVRQAAGPATLVEVRIHTGRMHQIRAHAASIGHPVIGDRKYGVKAVNQRYARLGLRRLYLHARQLRLPADDGFPALYLQAPTPPAFDEAVRRLLESAR